MSQAQINQAQIKDRIAGAIAGMVMGDALGVPGELWSREKLRSRFGRIDSFLDGPKDNIVACYFKAGQYTDDSAQAFVLLNALLNQKGVPSNTTLAKELLAWVKSVNGFEINLLGPSSKASLLAWDKGENPEHYTKEALTNGAAMRIAPVGALFDSTDIPKLVDVVCRVSSVTHASDVALSGASAVAQAVSSAISGKSWSEIFVDTKKAIEMAQSKGAKTWAAKIDKRLEIALKELSNITEEDSASLFIYEVIGTGTMTSESVPAALAIAFWAKTPEKAAIMSANMGGDTDTIGCMASAICGAKVGLSNMREDWISELEKTNNINFKHIAQEIYEARKYF